MSALPVVPSTEAGRGPAPASSERKIPRVPPMRALVKTAGCAWPLAASARLTSDFGPRRHPILKVRHGHSGIDLAAHGVFSV